MKVKMGFLAPWSGAVQEKQAITLKFIYLLKNIELLKTLLKIDEASLLSGSFADGYWGSGQMIAQNFSWMSTIPAATPNGNYIHDPLQDGRDPHRKPAAALHGVRASHYYERVEMAPWPRWSRCPVDTSTSMTSSQRTTRELSFHILIRDWDDRFHSAPGPTVWSGWRKEFICTLDSICIFIGSHVPN